MFAKIFSQIFDSSIAEDYVVRHVFMDLLALSDQDGVVDMTLEAISRRTNVPEKIVASSIKKLMEPDHKSRSSEEDGRRIVLIDSHRDWGWQIVNYQHYRDIKDEVARRTYFRDKKREQRSGNSGRRRGYVYYVASEMGIKIGYSANPWSRITEMRTFNPTIELIGMEPGDMQLERERHQQFSPYRIDREWFRKSREILAHVATLATSNSVQATETTKATVTQAEAEADTEVKSNIDSGSELMLAHWLFEELGIVGGNSERRVAADAIRLLAKEGGTMKQAADYILAAGREAIKDGVVIDRFWFTGQKYRPQTGGSNGTGKRSPAKERVDRNRTALAEAAIKRGWIVPDRDFGEGTEAVAEPGYSGVDGGISSGLRADGPEILPPKNSRSV